MFDKIIGNNENKKILENMVKKQNIPHSYIFSGISGIGKLLFAKEFAKAILCRGETIKPCNSCISCTSFENSNNPDCIIIDEQSESIKTEQIKELTKSVLEKPIESYKKIYIINNSENMTKEAQNSLLKTLEEPPEYIVILLITSNENMLLNTIKSRCMKLMFQPLSNNEIIEYFKRNNEQIDEGMLDIFEGSIEKALEVKDKKEIYEKINNEFKNIEEKSEIQILSLKEELIQYKEEIYSLLDYINTIFYKKMLKNKEKVLSYQECIKSVEETKARLKRNANFDMTIDFLLFSIERSMQI